MTLIDLCGASIVSVRVLFECDVWKLKVRVLLEGVGGFSMRLFGVASKVVMVFMAEILEGKSLKNISFNMFEGFGMTRSENETLTLEVLLICWKENRSSCKMTYLDMKIF